jgi:hypothetical protein
MKKVLAFALAGFFFASLGVAQDETLLKEFSRTNYFSGAKLTLVLLTDKTIDMLFDGASRDAMKAKTDTGTCFYILGTANKTFKMSTKFSAEQDGVKFKGTIENIQNLKDGEVAKGDQIKGILHLDKKLKIEKLFTVQGPGSLVDFKLSDLALRILAK